MVVAALTAWPAHAGRGPARPEAGTIEKVYYDGLDASGRLTGGATWEPVEARGPALLGSPVTTMLANGPTTNRIDLVFVGDGYLATQLGTFAVHAQHGLDDLLAQEPFSTYRTFFNAYRVDVVSIESGVDGDPVQGIYKDTALDMGFWCSGIERLLCVSTSKAWAYATAVPGADHVLAVANSTKYGGAGYTGSDLATYSGGNASATEVAIHEMGHSLGRLADEYDYGDGSTWTGPETSERNTSILNATAMATAGTKWTAWLGDPRTAYDGPVGTYEGAGYNQYGLYRPTFSSKMRALNRPFNLPSIEGLILEFYGIVSPIDDATPPATPLTWGSTVFVDPVDPVDAPLTIRWFLDGQPMLGLHADTLIVDSIGVSPGVHTLSVEVVDETPWVRDEAARAARMTESRSWTLTIPPPAGIEPVTTRGLALSVSPAPFTDAATLRYRLPATGRVRLTAHDVAGRTLAVLRDGVDGPGWHDAPLDVRALPTGLVVFRLETDGSVITRKAVRVR